MKNNTLLFLIIFSIKLWANIGDIKKAQNFSKNTFWAFEENKGQVTGADAKIVKYFYNQGNLTMFLTEKGIVYQFTKMHYPDGYAEYMRGKYRMDLDSMREYQKKIYAETYRMDIELVGANKNCEIVTEGKSPDYIQYYNHNALDVHAYQKITYKNIYPNIDWVIYTKPSKTVDGRLSSDDFIKYDFIVHPRGNPAYIRLQTTWVEDLKINENGSLSLKNRMGEIIENKPISFQNGREIETKFIQKENTIQFQVNNYQFNQDLVIDPTIVWATYYGGTDVEYPDNVCNDNLGNVYISGSTGSTTNIASGGYKNTYGGNVDAFLVKFNPDGTRIWATYYGGSNAEFTGLFFKSGGCSTDSSNNVYLVGYTSSSTNIAYNGFENNYTGNAFVGCAFIVKFNAIGQRLWGTYYNGVSDASCVVDKKNKFLYLLSYSGTVNRATSGVHQNFVRGKKDAVLSKFDLNGNRIWATYYGGQKDERSSYIAIDNIGNIYITGTTYSQDNISYNGHQDTFIGCIAYCRYGYSSDTSDIFLAKFNPNGALIWATYYGGSGFENSAYCITDYIGNVYLGGSTISSDRIAINGYRNYSPPFHESPFLVKFNSSGTRIWGTYYGDTLASSNGATGLYNGSCDNQGNIYIAGSSLAVDTTVYTSDGFQTAYSGIYDGLIVKFNPSGNRIWSTLWGGNESETLSSISIFNNLIYVTGSTYSDSLYSSYSGSTNLGYKGHKMNYSGNSDNILAKICSQTDTPKITISSDKSTTICPGTQVRFTAKDTFGGNTPHYIWRKNGTIVGTDTNIYSTAILSNNDTIQCMLISSATCIYKDTAWSNKIIIKLKLADTTHRFDTICSNRSYLFKSQLLSTSGIYKDSMTSSTGCDSFVFLHLYVKPFKFSSYDDSTTCSASPSYFFNGQNRTVSGIYTATYTAANGCDSIVTLYLKIKSTSSSSLPPITLCPGQSYFFNGQNRTTTGTYTQILTNSQGCDSTRTLILTILSTPIGINNPIWACNPFTFKGKTYTSNAIVIDTVKSSYGCDSLYRFNYINLKSKPDTLISNNLTVCDSVTYKNIVHKTSFSYTDTTRTTQNVVCDSTYQTTNYTIKYTPNITLSTKQEDTFFKGETITISANNIKNYLWNTGATKRDINIKLTQNESFYLIAWNDPECRDTAYTNITALDATILDFPTGFSPASKDHPENRTFRPNIIGKIERIQLEIFNRLGEKIYSSNNLATLGWDGTYKGVAAPQGVYTYLIEYVTNKRIFFKSGEVMLVR
jgi:gliding motility-associated-like protein